MNPTSPEVSLLLVDDDADMLLALKWTLEPLALQVRTAGSGEAALAAIAQAAPDIVLSDLQLGGMDGLALLEQVRRDHPSALCALHTGASVPPGVDGRFPVLRKPCNAEKLRRFVSGLIDEAKRGQEAPLRLGVRAGL